VGKVVNADLNSAINILHIPESLGGRRGQLLARDRGNGLKTSLVYRWTNGAGWVKNIQL
jgi:putative transposase